MTDDNENQRKLNAQGYANVKPGDRLGATFWRRAAMVRIVGTKGTYEARLVDISQVEVRFSRFGEISTLPLSSVSEIVVLPPADTPDRGNTSIGSRYFQGGSRYQREQ